MDKINMVGVKINRSYLISILSSSYPVYNVGQNYKKENTPYLVLKALQQINSINATKKGGFQYYEILCYVPDTSVILLDEVVDKVKGLLIPYSEAIEITNIMGGDFHDKEIEMYMRSIGIRVPKEV